MFTELDGDGSDDVSEEKTGRIFRKIVHDSIGRNREGIG